MSICSKLKVTVFGPLFDGVILWWFKCGFCGNTGKRGLSEQLGRIHRISYKILIVSNSAAYVKTAPSIEASSNGKAWETEENENPNEVQGKAGCLIGSCKNFPFPLLALWGNKNWLPSMKVKKLKIFQNKIGLKGCKWSSLDAPGTETPQSYPYWKLEEIPFLIISPLG